ncbi:hypothetical protein ABH904_000451 [Pseudomonas frederiksbergensis]
MLLEGQGDIESQAVFQAGTFMSRRHDAATGTGDDHHVRARQSGAKLSGQTIQWVFYRRAGRAENSDFASSLELLHHTEGMLEFAQGLQGDLGIPAVVIFLGHAQHSQDHVAVNRDVGAVG